MIISTQGSDTEETLSGEVGGMIKAYGNVVEGATSYKPYSTSSSDFDCYDASSRDEQVPSSVTAKNGGAKYSNFDTASDMYSYSVDAAADVPALVEAKSGRVNGGDFKWNFDDSTEDKNSDVITALKSALVSYKDTIVAIGSGFTDSTTPAQKTAPAQTKAPAQPQTQLASVHSAHLPIYDIHKKFGAHADDSCLYARRRAYSFHDGNKIFSQKTSIIKAQRAENEPDALRAGLISMPFQPMLSVCNPD